jgi:hypothetical protein
MEPLKEHHMPKPKAADVLTLSLPLHMRELTRKFPSNVPTAQERLQKLLAIATGYDDAVAANLANRDLSDSGRRKEDEKIALRCLEELKAYENDTVGKYRKSGAMLEDIVFKKSAPVRPTDVVERLAYELRMGELRRELKSLDPLHRLNIYLSTTDPEVLDAFESAPMVVTKYGRDTPPTLAPLVDPARVRAVRMERARAVDPESAGHLEAIAHLTELYSAAVGSVRAAVVEGVPTAHLDDPIAAQAAGTAPTK